MKKIILERISFCALLLSMLYPQIVLASFPLKKDDPGPGDVSPGMNSIKTYSRTFILSTESVYPVSADIINGELGIFFDYPVGTAYLTVTDVNGNIVAFETVDTYTASELYIPIEDLVSGHYTLRVSYGTTKLIGEFQL